MKTILAFLLTLFAACAAEAQIITAKVAFTNTPVYGATFTHNGVVRTWTNNVTVASTQITLTNSPATSATNLFYAYAQSPDPLTTMSVSGTNVFFYGFNGAANTISTVSNYVTVTYTTNSVTNFQVFRGSASLVGLSETTNTANGIVSYLSSVAVTNPIITLANSMSNYFSRFASNYVTGTNFFTGPNTFSNAAQLITGGSISNAILSNCVPALTNGYWSDGILTNAQNFGNPFRSPGTGTGSEQFGLGASASGAGASAFGDNATALGGGSVALGADSSTTDAGATALGNSSSADFNAVAIGQLANTAGTEGVAIGDSATSDGGGGVALGKNARNGGFAFAVAIGANALNSAASQIMLGDSSFWTYVPGGLTVAGGITNSILRGTNTIDGSLSFIRKNNTSLANGNNAAVNIFTNVIVNLSGPTAAFTIAGVAGGGNGRWCVLDNNTGYQMTILNDSGLDATAVNRIYTGTGADVVLTGNPQLVLLFYNTTTSHWEMFVLPTATVSSSASAITANIGTLTVTNGPTQTNFISGQIYSNPTTGRIQVSAGASLSVAAILGNSTLALRITGTGGATNYAAIGTAVTSIAMTYTNMLSGMVPAGGTFCFTNLSAGAGNSATVVGGQYDGY